jgi:peptide deformylase
MLELMHEEEGAGLAAPQVGLSWRMFVTKADDRRPDLVYVNPALGELDLEIAVREEGCLSLPGITAEVRRPATATMTALDLQGSEFTLRDDGLLARVWQHEVDHLDGVLIIDKMTPMDRIANRKPLKELESAARM